MLLWRYFEIGEGIKQAYTNVNFELSYEVILPFSETDRRGKNFVKKKTVRPDRQLCSLFFCQEIGCSSSFESSVELEEHMLAGDHQCSKLVSSMDSVKNSYVAKMKSSSQLHMPASNVEVNTASITLEDAIHKFPLMGKLKELGWALPIRSKFRFSYNQKKI